MGHAWCSPLSDRGIRGRQEPQEPLHIQDCSNAESRRSYCWEHKVLLGTQGIIGNTRYRWDPKVLLGTQGIVRNTK